MVHDEYALLGSLLYNTVHEAEIYKAIDGDAFTDRRCGEIFNIMKKMFYNGEPIDIITVYDKVELAKPQNRHLKSVDIAFISSLPDQCPVMANAIVYLKNIEYSYIKRRIHDAGGMIQQISLEGDYESILDLKNDAIKLLSDVRVSDEKGIGSSFFEVLDSCVNDIIAKRLRTKEEEEKLYTGYDIFDEITDGFHRQELTIIGARPAVGKTQFVLAIAKKLAEKGNRVLFFSREMGDKTLGNRFLSNLTGIEGHRLRKARSLSREEVDLVVSTRNNIERLKELNIIFNTTASTVQEIRSVVRELYLKKEVDVVIIDYLALLQSANHRGDRRSEIEYISRQLKLMTLDFNLPILCLSQLNRNSSRESRKPELHDLRETGQIEADADSVIFLHIPSWVTDINQPFPLQICIAKQRNGQVADVWLLNDRNKMNLYNLTEEEMEQIKQMENGTPL